MVGAHKHSVNFHARQSSSDGKDMQQASVDIVLTCKHVFEVDGILHSPVTHQYWEQESSVYRREGVEEWSRVLQNVFYSIAYLIL